MRWPSDCGLIVGALLVAGTSACRQPDACREFSQALEGIPHVALTTRTGPIESIWNGEAPAACEVAFETTDAVLAGAVVPDFVADAGSATYEAGWRTIPDILADGPGSGVYGIERNGVRCVIRWQQPAAVDDDGTIVQSEAFSLRLQCSPGSR